MEMTCKEEMFLWEDNQAWEPVALGKEVHNLK